MRRRAGLAGTLAMLIVGVLALTVPALGQAQAPRPAALSVVSAASLDRPGRTIPQSFMGFSHEWPFVEELYTIPQYADVIRLMQSFGSGPLVLRVGGGSTDHQDTVPPPAVWDALRKLHIATGMRYILGLNFFNGDVGLARRQMSAAQIGLPRESIMSFEIGNEPDYYVDKPSTHWNGSRVVASKNDYISCCYHTEWGYMAEQLSCKNGPDSCTLGQFTGPVWGHLNLRPSTMDWFLQTNAKWVEMTSVHWYKATAETANTAASLLDEDPIRKEMANLVEIVKVSNAFGKPLRVAEMNTISNSGRQGVSNVFAAALWTLDASFEVAQAGGVGVNFHQGAGQNLYAAVIRWYDNGRLAPPQLRPPFYGMLMFQMAVRGGSRLIGRDTVSSSSGDAAKLLKVWTLEDVQTQEIRWVVINKSPSAAGSVVLSLNRGSGYAPKGSVTRLLASSADPLSATSGILLGGISYGNGGVANGREQVEQLDAPASGGSIRLSLAMPAGSAALVRLPRQK